MPNRPKRNSNDTKKTSLPPQAMRFNFEGLEATRFWVRAFDLQKSVDEAVSMFKQISTEHDRVSCPIVSEYKIEGWGTFLWVMVLTADRIGLRDGVGSIFFASSEHLEKVTEDRDRLADVIIGSIPKNIIGGKMIIKSGTETGRPE